MFGSATMSWFQEWEPVIVMMPMVSDGPSPAHADVQHVDGQMY